jgi:hypothetical protein
VTRSRANELKYAIADGRGLMENQLKAIFQHNAVSILSHMHPLPDMKNKKLYLWMKDAFPVRSYHNWYRH